jgi:hypothetical protein
MEVGPIDADIAQIMLIERRELSQHPSVGRAGSGASPPQPEQPDVPFHDPWSAEVRGGPGSGFAARDVRSRSRRPASACHFGAFNLHSKISFKS